MIFQTDIVTRGTFTSCYRSLGPGSANRTVARLSLSGPIIDGSLELICSQWNEWQQLRLLEFWGEKWRETWTELSNLRFRYFMWCISPTSSLEKSSKSIGNENCSILIQVWTKLDTIKSKWLQVLKFIKIYHGHVKQKFLTTWQLHPTSWPVSPTPPSGDLQLALSNEPNCSQIALVHSSSSLKRDPPECSATQSPTPTKLVITQLILAVPKWENLEGSKNFFRCRRFPDKTKDRLDPKRRTEKHDDSSIPSPSGPGNWLLFLACFFQTRGKKGAMHGPV